MAKFRTQTPPAPGRVLQQLQEQIDELYRAISSRGGLGVGGGGFGGIGGGGVNANRLQHGNAVTDTNGKITVTFNPAFSSVPDIVAIAGGSGTDMLECQIVSLSATLAVIIVVGIPNAAGTVKTDIEDTGHTHHWGGQNTDSTPDHVHTIPLGTSQLAVQTDPAGTHVHGIGTFTTDGQSADHRHVINQVPQPTLRTGVTVYWIATL